MDRGHNPAMDARAAAQRARSHATNADWRSTLARSGLAAKGVLYGALGVLAISIANGGSSTQEASKRGAIELVASQPFGQWLLGILTVGLFAMAAWQAILAFTGDPVEGSETKDRVKFGGKALIYLSTASTALSVLLSQLGRGSGGPGSGGAATEQQAASTIMGWPGGPWLVGLLGAAVIGVALYQFYKHAMNETFMTRLDRGEMDDKVESGVRRAGKAGYASRAVVFVVIGIFLMIAAIQHDPQEAVGLSGALQEITRHTWGQIVLWAVAIGLFLFGCFSVAEAKYRRAT